MRVWLKKRSLEEIAKDTTEMMRVKCFRQNDSFVLLFELKIVGGRMDSDIYWSIFSELHESL